MNRALILSLLLAACEYRAPIGADNDAGGDAPSSDVADVNNTDVPVQVDGDRPPRDAPDVPAPDVPAPDVPAPDVPAPDVPASTFSCSAGNTCTVGAQICQGPRPPGICPMPDAGFCPLGCPGCGPLPPPSCAPMPATCAAAPSCDCILRALCGFPTGGACTGDAATGFTASCRGA